MAYKCISPTKTLDQQILPLLHHVHNRKIISYQQFKQELLVSEKDATGMDQTLPVFAQPTYFLNKRELQNSKPIVKRKPRLHKNVNLLTLSPGTKKSQEQKEKIIYVSPTSKVKRHLADDINIKIMRQAMFQKRQVANRYEQFCKSLSLKDNHQAYRTRQQSTKQTHRLFSSQIQKNKQTINESFRTTTRKIFWVKNRDSQQSKQYPQFLSIKCLSRQKRN